MRILFVHQNFPAQFVHLAPALMQRGHDVRALTFAGNKRPTSVQLTRYEVQPRDDTGRLGALISQFAVPSLRGEEVAKKAEEMRRGGYTPDFIFGHLGWGETLYLKEVWPIARLALYAEFFYHTDGLDCGFDTAIYPQSLESRLRVTAKQASPMLAMLNADKALAPTRWQADSFPDWFRPRITVNHDGIDTDTLKPDSAAIISLAQRKVQLKAGDEVLTFVNRNLEPYRGYHIFMRALPRILTERPNAHVIIVGADNVSYGAPPGQGRNWKRIFLDEVRDRLDLSRVHFVGQIPYPVFVTLMQVSRVHAYLTYPFVLSWSMLEAMSAGAYVIGSSTGPVTELIEDGVNGRLVDFFDVEGWSSAIIDGLADPERQRPLREAARRTIVEAYDLKRHCLPRLVEFVEAA